MIPTTPSKELSAMQELIEFLKEERKVNIQPWAKLMCAKIELTATELLEKEKSQIGDAHYDGQRCAGCKHPSGHDALAFFTNKYSK